MIRWGWIFPIGCFASSATSVAWELAARAPAPFLSATPFGH